MNETEQKAVKVALGERVNAQGYRIFTEEGRRLALLYCERRMKEGLRAAEVSAELGLKGWTLQRWMQRERRGQRAPVEEASEGFSQVKVVAPAAVCQPVVHAPFGVRVEGLSVEQIGRCLRELTCSA